MAGSTNCSMWNIFLTTSRSKLSPLSSDPSTFPRDRLIGFLAAVGAQCVWGFVIVYFKAVADVSPLRVVAHRAVWALPLIVLLLLATRGLPRLAALVRDPKTLAFLPISALLLGLNWLGFVYCVVNGQILQSALAYFVTPLMMAALGVFVLGERLRRLQWLGLALAAVGVAVLILWAGVAPWIGLGLGAAWSLYSLIRRAKQIPAVEGLVLELAMLALAGGVYLALSGFLPPPGTTRHAPAGTLALLMLGGVITAVPLTLYGLATRRLTLTTLGFIQYLGPTIQFVLAVALYGEAFPPQMAVAYALIWAALLVFILDSRHAGRSARRDLAEATPTAAAARIAA